MNGEWWILWLVLMLVGFAGSALYSGLETGLYTLNRIRLHIDDQQGRPAAMRLRRLVDHPTRLLGTLLVGNNIMNQLGTVSLGMLLLAWGLSDTQTVILNIAIVTPILFVFGETLPKDLFSVYADRLMYRLDRVLQGSQKLFTWMGLVPLIRAFSWLMHKAIGGHDHALHYSPRVQMNALMRESVGYGVISEEQSALVQRVLQLRHKTLRQVMVDWKQVLTLRHDATPEAIETLARSTSHARYPVLDADGRVLGVIRLMDLLETDLQRGTDIASLTRPLPRLSPHDSVPHALEVLRREGASMGLVQDEQGQPLGIVTLKNLIDPMTGNLSSW